MPLVNIKGVGPVKFPDDMTQDQIAEAIQRNMAKQQQQAMPEAAGTVGSATSRTAQALGVSDNEFSAYRNTLGGIESNNRYDIMGGANNHYAGRFQLGDAAIKDASGILGIAPPDKTALLQDPKLQDELFDAYTTANFNYLNKGSEKFRNLSPREKMKVLGYAHNQGWGGAKNWLETGNVGSDAFGTKGTKYVEALDKAFGDVPSSAPESGITNAPKGGKPYEVPLGSELIARLKTEEDLAGFTKHKNMLAEANNDDDIEAAIKAAPASFKQFLGDLVYPITNFSEFTGTMKRLGMGAYEKFTPGIQENEALIDAVGQFYVDRYGSIENARKTFRTDPVGFFADLSMVLTLGGTASVQLAKAPGMLARATGATGRIAQNVTRAAENVSSVAKGAVRAGAAIDPTNVVTRPVGAAVKGIGYGASSVGGLITGTSGESVRSIARAGAEGGERQGVVTRGMRHGGNAERLAEPVQMVENALDNIRVNQQTLYRAGMKDVKQADAVAQQAGKRVSLIPIRRALNSAKSKTKTGPFDKLTDAGKGMRNQIEAKIAEFEQAAKIDPTLMSVEGLDALKQSIGQYYKEVKPGSLERTIVDDVYMGIKDEIVRQAPEYARVMEGFDRARQLIREIEDEFSLARNADRSPKIGTKLRKLQSALRANAYQGWDWRVSLQALLEENGAPHLMEALSGQAMSQWQPRGMSRQALRYGLMAGAGGSIGGGILAGAGVLGTGGLAALLTGGAMAAMSPRLWGEGALAAGRANRFLRDTKGVRRGINQSMFQTSRISDQERTNRKR